MLPTATPPLPTFMRESELSHGKGKGATLLDVDNGRLRFTVTPDTGMDILDLTYRGDNFAYRCKNGYTTGAYPHDFAARFPGGFLYTCGLEAVGAQEGLPMHGSFHRIPADNFSATDGADTLEICGLIRDSVQFGRHLTLHRVLQTAPGSSQILLTDTVKNCGAVTTPYVIMYHFNLGYPFLDAGTRISAPIIASEPVSDWARENLATALIMTAPNEPVEQCFTHTLAAPDDGMVTVAVENFSQRRRVKFTYDAHQLPYFNEWKSMLVQDYALGIEPATTPLRGKNLQRELAPQAAVTYKFILSFEEW
jgi:hypothetical protein